MDDDAQLIEEQERQKSLTPFLIAGGVLLAYLLFRGNSQSTGTTITVDNTRTLFTRSRVVQAVMSPPLFLTNLQRMHLFGTDFRIKPDPIGLGGVTPRCIVPGTRLNIRFGTNEPIPAGGRIDFQLFISTDNGATFNPLAGPLPQLLAGQSQGESDLGLNTGVGDLIQCGLLPVGAVVYPAVVYVDIYTSSP